MDRRTFLTGAASIGLGATAFRPAFAQWFPSNVIRIVVPVSASTPPDILARIVANALSDAEGWKVIVENKPGGVMTHRRDRGAEAARRRPHDLVGHRAGRGGAGSRAQRAVQVREGLRAADPDRHRLQRAGGQSFGPGPFGHRTGRVSEEGPRQAHVLVGRLRHARASDRRDVQARDRRGGDACALQPIPAGDRRPGQRREHLPVHHHPAGGAAHQDRQAPRAGGDADRSASPCCPTCRPSPRPAIPKLDQRGLGRACW